MDHTLFSSNPALVNQTQCGGKLGGSDHSAFTADLNIETENTVRSNHPWEIHTISNEVVQAESVTKSSAL